jgi:hypothetical protein
MTRHGHAVEGHEASVLPPERFCTTKTRSSHAGSMVFAAQRRTLKHVGVSIEEQI